MNDRKTPCNRRAFLQNSARGAGLLLTGATLGFLPGRTRRGGTVWQIDPYLCIQCGKCETECVLRESAVKCVHEYSMCGYCEICTGFMDPSALEPGGGAENELCPTGAIIREFVETPYYSYTINEPLCVGCGKCVKGCAAFGNGSLYLQIRHDRCLNCNHCTIAEACPAQAISRVPADQPYIRKRSGGR